MKSIKLLAIIIIAITFTSCGEKGLDVNVYVDPYGNQYQPVNIGGSYYPYYSGNVPQGVTQFVGYVRGGSTNPSSIPVFYSNGTPMGIGASAAGLSGQMAGFFLWLQSQSSSRMVPVVIEMYRQGITYGWNYNITWVAW